MSNVHITSEIKDKFGNVEVIIVYPGGAVWSYTLDGGFWASLKQKYAFKPGTIAALIKKASEPNVKASKKLPARRQEMPDDEALEKGKAFLSQRFKSPKIRKAAGLDEARGYGKYDGWYKLNGTVELVRTAHAIDLYTRPAAYGLSQKEVLNAKEKAKVELQLDTESGIVGLAGARDQEWLTYLVCEALTPLVYARGWYKVRTLPQGIYVAGKNIKSSSIKNKLFFLLRRFYPEDVLYSPKTVLADYTAPDRRVSSFNESKIDIIKESKMEKQLYEQMLAGIKEIPGN